MRFILFFATLVLATAAHAKLVLNGSCASQLTRDALESDIESGTVHVGPYAELNKILRAAGVDEVHIDNIDKILKAVEDQSLPIAPLQDLVQLLKSESFTKSLSICVPDKSCEFSMGHENAAAYFIKWNDRSSQMSFTSFAKLPETGSEDWMELERRALTGSREFLAQGSPNAVVVKPFRDRSAGTADGFDPLPLVNTFEGELLHELVHAADVEILRLWVSANMRLISLKQSPDELFTKFAKISPITGRVFVAHEFFTIFSESRGYEVVWEVRKLFPPLPPNAERLKHQIFFAPWLYVVNDAIEGNFNAAKIAGLPTTDDFRKALENPTGLAGLIMDASQAMQKILHGPNAWRETVVKTIHRAMAAK